MKKLTQTLFVYTQTLFAYTQTLYVVYTNNICRVQKKNMNIGKIKSDEIISKWMSIHRE